MQGGIVPSGADDPAYPSLPDLQVSCLRSEEFNAPVTRSRNQGGRGQRAGPLRSRLEEEPDGVSCGANGAAPRDGTVSQELVSRTAVGDPILDERRSRPMEAPNRRGVRTRWTEEDNILIMRVHFIARDVQERTGRTYRELLNDINPQRQSYANLLANRVRYLMDREKFSSVELDEIKRSFIPRSDTIHTDHQENETATEGRVHIRLSIQPSRLERVYYGNLLKYSGLSPYNRPKIPRLKHSIEMVNCVERVNAMVERYVEAANTLREMVDCVYAGAVTVCEELRVRIGEVRPMHGTGTTPPWQVRLERKIKFVRKRIGILNTYLNTETHTKKLMKGIRQIASESRIRTHGPKQQFNSQLELVCDKLKQKIKVLGNRMKRYNERVKRFKNNQLYYKNPKEFFRTLEAKETTEGSYPAEKDMYETWRGIWERDESHDDEAFWIRNAEGETLKYDMENLNITGDDITLVLKKTSNWTAPGSDKLHNYWWKNFTSTHQKLATLFQEALSDPTIIPEFLTLGVTHMIPKGNVSPDPKAFRPITCLPTVYKILTGIITKHLWKHVSRHKILAREQNGCRKNAQGCKELLTIDHLVTKQARKRLKNISIAWIDYKKAFDTVPHSWLLKILEIYGVSANIIELLKHLMTSWRTSLIFDNKRTPEIRISTGIFQGDKLSTLWFCLAMNPLSRLLNDNRYGYIIDTRSNTRITHQLYVDDLKLYATNEEQLRCLMRIVTSFTQTIKMEMGLDKCAVIHVKRGKLTRRGEMFVRDELAIKELGPDETYKYLGIQQALEIRSSEQKETFKSNLFGRVRKVLASKLNSKAMFTAINTWAVPSIAYSFGIIKWSKTDLKAIDTQIRVLLSKCGIHHPHASVNRLYLPRHQGGRGLQNIEMIHNKTVVELREYFHSKNSPFLHTICQEDLNITALNLGCRNHPPETITRDGMIAEWHSKALHGRYPEALKENRVNKELSLTYLKSGYLFPETEGRLAAIQDQVVPTRAYIKHIAKKNIPTDKCRKCSQALETIQHITSSCSILAPREYTHRHNAMAKVFHQAIANKTGLLTTVKKIHEYVPKPLLENSSVKIYWDERILTDRMIPHNRPDIVVIDKTNRKATIIDITVPADDNIARAYSEKLLKYHDLAFEMKEIYHLRSISILPLIISSNELVETHLVENVKHLELDQQLISQAQKEVILWTTRIVRMFMTTT
ncbi:uncharacterized protein LOC123306999 [Coccinella septempunctata]|uniref:uncharacterized protein LOC123306999 n=1 Tax=Coccinella septempunctata TaxID=41139 RepID=UPI001D07C354|nr:uncharacterized protein LOC123306999 [Coccinella septempunctata]